MKRIKPDDPMTIELMNFLIERTKDGKSPLRIKDLADEYMRKKGWSSIYLSHLTSRITTLLQNVGKSEALDIATKAKMMFASGLSVSQKLLKEFRRNAYVEIDEYHRMTKYRARDGSLNLEGVHPLSANSRAKVQCKIQGRPFNGSRIPESTKRAAVKMPDNSTKWPGIDHVKPWNYVPSELIRISTKRAAVEVPDDSSKLHKIDHRKPGASRPSLGDFGSFEHLNQDPFRHWPLNGSIEILNHPGVQLPQEPPRKPPNSKIQDLREPRTPEAPKRAPEPSGVDALIIKFLKMIQSLILSLGIPQSQLTEIHRKIQQKIQKIGGNTIKNNEVTLALGLLMALVLELLVTRIVSHSVRNFPENQISVSLKRFLCYLRAAILNSNLEGLENILKKIEENINTPDLNDKYIPVEKVTEALQDTLTNIGF
ncbi:unnamed protein product [Caenorhabditis brenneri]